jgi:branched-subunit amino acid transport protein
VKKSKQKLHGEPRHLQLFKPDFWVTLPTLIVALKTRSLAATVLTGMALLWLYTRFFP